MEYKYTYGPKLPTILLTKKDCQEIIAKALDGRKMYKKEFLERVGNLYPERSRTRDGAYQKIFEKLVSQTAVDLDRLEEWENSMKSGAGKQSSSPSTSPTR